MGPFQVTTCLNRSGIFTDPGSVKIPERFKQVVTWKGPMDTDYLDSLQKTYAQRIQEMAKSEDIGSP